MKEKLAELIEAYAAAKASGNRMLIEWAAARLQELFSRVEIKESETHAQ